MEDGFQQISKQAIKEKIQTIFCDFGYGNIPDGMIEAVYTHSVDNKATLKEIYRTVMKITDAWDYVNQETGEVV